MANSEAGVGQVALDVGLPAQSIASCGDVSCEFLVDPIPRPAPEPFTVKLKPNKRQIVFIDNGKPNSMNILRTTQAVLRARGVDVREEIPAKPYAGIPIEGDLLAAASREQGMVLLGVND